MNKYFLDLFSGIGGFAIGAYFAGLRFDTHYFSEVDDYAINIYKKRFPDATHLGDIKTIDGRDLPSGEWIITGGFPCQDISVAGKGAGLSGARSGLWYEYARLIGELRPRFAIMENVGALAFRGLDSVLGSLAALGYDAEWQDIRASDVGAPHRRERIWIIAYPIGERFEGQGGCWNGIYKKKDNYREAGWLVDAFQGEAMPYVCRRHDGISNGMDRLKCLGNSVVPEIPELIFTQPAFDNWR